MTSDEHHRAPDLIVVGAGAIGLAIAWRAARRGLGVLVLDRGEPGHGTTWVAAGMLAPTAEAAFGEDTLAGLNVASARLWPGFAQELSQTGDPGLTSAGTLFVARDADAARALERERELREQLGLEVRPLLPSDARRLEPALAPAIRAGLELPLDQAVDPRALAAALAGAAVAAGASIRTGAEVSSLTSDRGRVTGVRLVGGERIAAGAVCIAAGVWSAGIEMDATVPPLRPVKGQLLRLRDPDGPGLLTRVLRSEEVYVVPRADGTYVVGATMEEQGWDTSVTAGAAFELLRAASELLPGVLELELEDALAGLRPCTPDNAPAIGRGDLEGLLWAVGHHRNGILLTPLTAEAVAALAAGEKGDPQLEPFAPARFAGDAARTDPVAA
jgi:glycine oxidase